MNRYSVILAAGKGTRMKSRDVNYSKVSFPILGKALVNYVLDAVSPLDIDKNVVVVGFGGEVTKSLVEDRAEVVWQHEILGTGHALMQAAPILEGKKGSTIVLCGDTPLLTSDTLQKLYKKHEKSNADITILSAVIENPKGYGRIIREYKTEKVIAIREDKDCTSDESDVSEINSGVYVFNNELLFKYLKLIKNNNSQKEYYLTDLVELFVNDNLKVETYIIQNAQEIFGINDRVQLAYAAKVIKKRVNNSLMMSGVSIEDPESTYISPDVQIGRDTIIMPNTTILGKSKIGEGNIIGPNSYLHNVIVGDDNVINSSYLTDTKIGSKNEVGPYTKTRANTVITDNCRVGNFVELKNAVLHNGVKCAHLSYLGDATVGDKTNVGCMTVTANYDGYNKSQTHIGKNVFVGSGTILIAPVNLEDESFTAAGSTITHDVDTNDLAIARARQVNIKGGSSKIKKDALEIKTSGKKKQSRKLQ